MTPATIINTPDRATAMRQARVMGPLANLTPRKIRPWTVVHACDYARDVADVIDAQVSAGMRPYLLTVAAEVPVRPSILQTWQDVRRWKKALDESNAHTTPDLIHAHSFASGMAGVRMNACVVYDLRRTIEEHLAAAEDAPGPWLCGSFRTAELFAMSRAAAVVTHSPQQREECIARGVAPDNIFVVPDPLPVHEKEKPIPERERAALEARCPQHVAERYDEIYRYAFTRRRTGDNSGDASGSLIPIPANL